MIWLDYFLQVFVHALAWSLAIGVTLTLIGWGLWTLVRCALGDRS